MAKVNEIIYDVREGLSLYTDDSEINNEYILYLYNIKRAKYLRQDLNNYQRSRDNSILQTFCLDMEPSSADECSISLSCKNILKSKKPIPTPLELHTKVALTKVKPTGRIDMPFNFINKDKAAFLDGAIIKSGVYAFLDNDDHIYLISNDDSSKLIDCITVTGIFEDPLDLKNYNNCCNCEGEDNECFNQLTSDYPLQPHYIDLIRKEIISELAALEQVVEDRENDAIDER